MRPRGKTLKIALAVLLPVAGYAAYRVVERARAADACRAADEAIARRDFRAAGDSLKRCLAARPDDPALRLLAARTARRAGDFDAARRELESHERLKGSEDERRRELRLLSVQQGRDAVEAERLLQSVLDSPDAPDADYAIEVVVPVKLAELERAYNAGMTLVEGPAGRERERAEAAVALWLARRAGPADRAQGLVWRGRTRLLLDAQAAAGDFREALDLDPNNADARLRLATALADYDPKAAAEHLEILRRRDPADIQVRVMLAYFRRGLGRLDDARQLLDEVLAAQPGNAAALLERGKVALDAGRPDEAEGFLRKALAAAPDEPFVHLALSRCLHQTGKSDEAERHQRRYDELESARVKAERLRTDDGRAAWRKRLELELLRKGTPSP